MNATTNRHRCSPTYERPLWSNPMNDTHALNGATCRECGQEIARTTPYGTTPAQNRAPWIPVADVEAAYAYDEQIRISQEIISEIAAEEAARDAFLADAKATASRAGLTVPERQAYVAAEANRYDEEIAGSLVLVLDTDEILAALAERDVALADRDRSQRQYENELRRAGRFTRRYREAAEHYAQCLDLARANVERAVRAANVGAPEALIVSTARNL